MGASVSGGILLFVYLCSVEVMKLLLNCVSSVRVSMLACGRLFGVSVLMIMAGLMVC